LREEEDDEVPTVGAGEQDGYVMRFRSSAGSKRHSSSHRSEDVMAVSRASRN